MLADGIAQTAHDARQGAEALRQLAQEASSTSSTTPAAPPAYQAAAECRPMPPAPHTGTGGGQRSCGDHAVEAQIAGQGGLFRGGDFQQDAAGLRARQFQQFLGPLAARRRPQSRIRLAERVAPGWPDSSLTPNRHRPWLPETLRRIQNEKFKLFRHFLRSPLGNL